MVNFSFKVKLENPRQLEKFGGQMSDCLYKFFVPIQDDLIYGYVVSQSTLEQLLRTFTNRDFEFVELSELQNLDSNNYKILGDLPLIRRYLREECYSQDEATVKYKISNAKFQYLVNQYHIPFEQKWFYGDGFTVNGYYVPKEEFDRISELKLRTYEDDDDSYDELQFKKLF